MQQDNSFLVGLFLLVFLFVNCWIAYELGKQSTISKVENIIDAEHLVSIDNISIEDLKLEISKLR